MTTEARAPLRLATLAAIAWVTIPFLSGTATDDGTASWTVLEFLASLVLPIWCCVRARTTDQSSRVDLFQPGTVFASLFYFYFVIPAFHVWRDLDYQSAWLDPTWPSAPLFQRTFALCLLGLVAFGVGYRFSRPIHHRSPPPTSVTPFARWPHSATVAAVAMLVIGFPFRLQHLVAIGGLTPNVLLFLSPTYQVESGIQIGGIRTFFETFVDWGALLLLLRAIVTGKQRLLALVLLIVAALLAYVESGKRSAILPFLLYPVVWAHYLKRWVSVRRGLLYLGLGVALMAMLLFMRTLGPLLATGGLTRAVVPAEIALAPVRFYINSPELAVFDMTMLAVQDRAPLLHEIGGRVWGGVQYNLAPAAYIVPRLLWPGKPTYKDLGQVFFQHAVGEAREDVGFSVGIVGGLHLFGGVVGVVAGMIAVGALFRVLYERIRPWSGDARRVFIYGIVLWMAFLFVRFGTLGFTIMYFIQFQLPGLIVGLLVLNAPGRRRAIPP